jgi:hypothetical protein
MARRKARGWESVTLPQRSIRVRPIVGFDSLCSLCGENAINGYLIVPYDADAAEINELRTCSGCATTFVFDAMRGADPGYDAMISRKEWEQGIIPRDVEGYKQRIAIVEKELRVAMDTASAEAGRKRRADWAMAKSLRDERLPNGGRNRASRSAARLPAAAGCAARRPPNSQ